MKGYGGQCEMDKMRLHDGNRYGMLRLELRRCRGVATREVRGHWYCYQCSRHETNRREGNDDK